MRGETRGRRRTKRRVDLDSIRPRQRTRWDGVLGRATTDGDVRCSGERCFAGRLTATPAVAPAEHWTRGQSVVPPFPRTATVQVALSRAPTTGCTVELLDATVPPPMQPPQAVPVVNGCRQRHRAGCGACASGVYLVRLSRRTPAPGSRAVGRWSAWRRGRRPGSRPWGRKRSVGRNPILHLPSSRTAPPCVHSRCLCLLPVGAAAAAAWPTCTAAYRHGRCCTCG